MATFPKDQFDTLPQDLARQGAHRAPKKKGGGWLGFLIALVATVVLIGGGLYAVSLVNESFKLPGLGGGTDEVAPTPSTSATPEVAAIEPGDIDKKRKITITILNGTAVSGLEGTASTDLKKLKWPVTSAVTSSQNDIEETFVYYSNPADEDVARGLVLALGLGEIRESTAFQGAPINIVLGDDYAKTR